MTADHGYSNELIQLVAGLEREAGTSSRISHIVHQQNLDWYT